MHFKKQNIKYCSLPLLSIKQQLHTHTKCCSLTRVKLIALYKYLMTKITLTYISNKQNVKYCSLATIIANQTISILHTYTHTHTFFLVMSVLILHSTGAWWLFALKGAVYSVLIKGLNLTIF